MSVNHLLFIKFHPHVTDERAGADLAALESLTGRVPGILGLTLGKNFTDRAAGYTHGVVVTLANRDALAAYIAHPHHVEVATQLRADADYLVMDYEF